VQSINVAARAHVHAYAFIVHRPTYATHIYIMVDSVWTYMSNAMPPSIVAAGCVDEDWGGVVRSWTQSVLQSHRLVSMQVLLNGLANPRRMQQVDNLAVPQCPFCAKPDADSVDPRFVCPVLGSVVSHALGEPFLIMWDASTFAL
jgi:hypothetical protein